MAEYKTTIEKTDEGTRIKSGNMTDEQAARLAAERERTKDMNVDDASQAAQDSLENSIKAKNRFTEMQNMLAAGKHKDMTDEEKEKFVAEYKKLKADYSFAKGGMPKQMELFDDGGLMDEGGTTDPVSGNDVPPGSTQEEVRDDIPAQLSEGEFVVPADVVRYIGLENLMRMRQEAKQGLAEMEAMGQMGNSEEATMPDNLPFNEYDLDIEDDGLEMNVGGYVPPSSPNQVNPMTGVYQTGSTGITGFQNYQGQPTGFTPYGGATPFFQPTQFTGPQYTTALQTTNLPTFAETVGKKAGQYDELRTYQNDAGQTLQIPFKNGQPIYPVPEGYTPMADQPTDTKTSETTVTPIMGQTQTGQDTGDGGEINNTFVGGQTLKDFREGKETNKDRFAISGRRGFDLMSIIPGGNLIRELLGVPEIAPFFQKDPESLPTPLGGPSAPFGPKDLSELPTMSEADRLPGKPSPGSPSLSPASGLLPASVQTARNLRALRTQLGVDPTRYASMGTNNRAGDFDPATGGFFSKQGLAIDPNTGEAAVTELGSRSYRSFGDWRKATTASIDTGWAGGMISKDKFDKISPAGQVKYNKYAEQLGYKKGGTLSVDQIKDDQRDEANKEAAKQASLQQDRTTMQETLEAYQRDKGGAADNKDVSGSDGSSAPGGIGGDFGGMGSEAAFKSGGLAKQMKRSGLASRK
tara:strand:- start:15549 stop:17627 length:2079 start_codon:yes stop_codon:yes gene_type:complete